MKLAVVSDLHLDMNSGFAEADLLPLLIEELKKCDSDSILIAGDICSDALSSIKVVDEIRSAVLLVHGEDAHSCYFSKDAYAGMIKDSMYADNKELMIIPGAVHTDLYDGGSKDAIPFDKLEGFFNKYLK